MSWQSYVDDQLLATKLVSRAAIAGHDGNIWATSEGFPATAAEIKVGFQLFSVDAEQSLDSHPCLAVHYLQHGR
jgi:hypothetical protein